MKKILVCLSLIAAATNAQDVKRVIFLGNSYTGVNNLPNLIKECALSVDDTLIYSANTPGGFTLEGHSTNATTLSLINSSGWDYVVLQDQSQRPSFPDAQVEVEVYPFAKKIDSIFNANNECGETLFYMTWGRKNGDASNCPTWPPVCTYSGMDSLLNLRYRTMANDNNAEVSPVGEVWHYIRDTYPSIELYSGDESHPSAAGSYAAAITFYTAIFKKDPSYISYDFSLSAADAENIRTAVKTVVFDDLLEWHIGEYDAQPIFSSALNSGFTYDFTNESINATSVKWNIDGTNYAIENPTHTFPSNGIYSVELTAMNECDTIVRTENVAIGGTIGFTEVEPLEFKTFPNPVDQALYLSYNSEEVVDVRMISLEGKILLEFIHLPNTPIDVSFLDPGIYLIQVIQPNGSVASTQFVKK